MISFLNKTMKIFYISKYATPSKDGNSDRKYILSKYMNRHADKVTLIYSRSNGKKYKSSLKLFQKEIFEGLECIRINGITLKQMGINFRRMFSWIQFEINLFLFFIFLPKSKRPDVVIASSFSLFTFYTVAILKKIYKFKMLVEVRDICPQTEVEFGRIKESGIIYKIFKYIELFGYKHADKIFSTIPKFDDYLKTQGVFKKDFLWIPQGFDKEYIPPLKTKDSSGENFTVMYAGTIGEVNLVEEICIAAEQLQNTNIQFIIYGDGPLKESLKQKYSHLQNLDFKGVVSKRKIAEILMGADLLINMWADKSVYQYGVSPNKWIDYMLAAVPILVTYNGYQNIINEAWCGWFIKANDPKLMANKILEISKMSPTELRQIGLNGRKYAIENHDYEMLANKLLNFIYE